MLIILIQSVFAYSGYQTEYLEIIENNNDEEATYNAMKQFFDALSDNEVLIALDEISELDDYQTIFTDIILFINPRFDNTGFRNKTIEYISDNANETLYRNSLINILEDKFDLVTEDRQRIEYETVLYNIAIDNSESLELRVSSASQIGLTSQLEINKQRLLNLISLDETKVINAASSSIKNYIFSEDLSRDLDFWSDNLINILEQHNDKNSVKGLLFCLAYTGTDTAQNYLLSLFNQNREQNVLFTHTLIYTLSYFSDVDLMIEIYTNIMQDENYKDYNTQLVLLYYIKENVEVLEILKNLNTSQSKIVFAKSIQLLRDPITDDNKEYLIDLLQDVDETVVLSAIQSLHFILPYEDEKVVFSNLRQNNRNDEVLKKIFTYIGRE